MQEKPIRLTRPQRDDIMLLRQKEPSLTISQVSKKLGLVKEYVAAFLSYMLRCNAKALEVQQIPTKITVEESACSTKSC